MILLVCIKSNWLYKQCYSNGSQAIFECSVTVSKIMQLKLLIGVALIDLFDVTVELYQTRVRHSN